MTSEKPCIPYICTSGARKSWSRRPGFKGNWGKEVIVLMNFDCFIVTMSKTIHPGSDVGKLNT